MEKSLSELLVDWVILVASATIDLFIDRALSFSSPHPLAPSPKGEGGKREGE